MQNIRPQYTVLTSWLQYAHWHFIIFYDVVHGCVVYLGIM